MLVATTVYVGMQLGEATRRPVVYLFLVSPERWRREFSERLDLGICDSAFLEALSSL
jgi:hypothetical protein